ncbi:MAG: hypothetical protein WAO09_01170 [Candidatus Dormiibacterota bacterium]|jgi:hypothetical protein
MKSDPASRLQTPDRRDGPHDGEVRIRPPGAHRLRAATSAGGVMAAVLVPLGLIAWVLIGTWSPLALAIFTVLLVTVASYLGQGRNELFVGPRGIRRRARNCDLTASWPSLRCLVVNVPGNRIVAFRIDTSGLAVERLTTWHSNSAEALVRHPPNGFDFRLDRESADALVDEVSRRRPDLVGLAEWPEASRPSAVTAGR